MLPRGGLLLMLLLAPGQVLAADVDEPGAATSPDEPGVVELLRVAPSTAPASRFRIELGAGYASLLEDPDLGEGYGAGLSASVEIARRVGVEVSAFLSRNPYTGDLAAVTDVISFLAGNISLGPFVRLTPPTSRWLVTIDAGLGAYFIKPVLPQDDVWTLGVHMGTTIGLKIFSWVGLSLKVRYHLFNLANLSGPKLIDINALQEVGVVDRFEIPVYLTFFF